MRFFLFLFALVFGFQASALELYKGTIVSAPSGTVKNNLNTVAPFSLATGNVLVQCNRDAWMAIGADVNATVNSSTGLKLLKDVPFETKLSRTLKVIAVVDVTVQAGSLECKVFEVKELATSTTPRRTFSASGVYDPLVIGTVNASSIVSATVTTSGLQSPYIESADPELPVVISPSVATDNVAAGIITATSGQTLLVQSDGINLSNSAALGTCSPSSNFGTFRSITVGQVSPTQRGLFYCDGTAWRLAVEGYVTMAFTGRSSINEGLVSGIILGHIPTSTYGQVRDIAFSVHTAGTCTGACVAGQATLQVRQGASVLCQRSFSCTATGKVAAAACAANNFVPGQDVELLWASPQVCTTNPVGNVTVRYDLAATPV